MDKNEIDCNEFLRLVYLLAENHFKYNDINVSLVSFDDQNSSREDRSELSFYADEDYGGVKYIASSTDKSLGDKYPFFINGAMDYIIEIFFKDTDTLSSEIIINEHNFELLKMLTSLNREEMELWMKLK